MTIRMRFILALAALILASCTEAEDNRKARHEKVASTVAVIMADLNNPKWIIRAVDVARPNADWCPTSSIKVRSCGSARPKRDRYWLEISCADKAVYVAEYDHAFPNSLTLVNLNDREICRRKL